MNFLEERIVKDGVVKPGNVLKVDSFLNHQMDIHLMDEMGKEFKRRFADKSITKMMCRWCLQRNQRALIWTVKCMWQPWNPLPIKIQTR